MLLKNTIMTLIPIIAILTLMVWGMHHFKLLNNLDFAKVNSLNELDEVYEAGTENVEMTFDKLSYLGYDYKLNGKTAGGYYYAFLDDMCVVVLIDSNETSLYDYTVKGVVKNDNTLYSYVLTQCAEDMNLELEQLKAVTYDYVISEVDYPYAFYTIVKAAFYVAVIIMILSVAEALIYIVCPWLHPQIRRVKKIKNKRLLVRDINRSIHDTTIYHNKNVTVTRKYLIITSLVHTDIIILSDIEVISKHKERKRSLIPGTRKAVYKLIISNSEDMFYEHEFPEESTIDEMMRFLRR
jgi:hypothetical protein